MKVDHSRKSEETQVCISHFIIWNRTVQTDLLTPPLLQCFTFQNKKMRMRCLYDQDSDGIAQSFKGGIVLSS